VPQCKCLASLRFGSSSWWVHKIGVVTDLVTWWDRRCQVTISHKLHHFRGVSTKVIKYFTVHGMDSHRKIIVFFQLMDRGNCFLHYTLTRLLYILGTLHCIHMYTLSTFNIVRISSIYVDYWVYLLTYFELTLSILCILDSVKTLLSRGTYGEESNQLHHPGGSICSAVQTSQRSSLWRIE
jgi:hypothetical protein